MNNPSYDVTQIEIDAIQLDNFLKDADLRPARRPRRDVAIDRASRRAIGMCLRDGGASNGE